jgi:hypothetical protein
VAASKYRILYKNMADEIARAQNKEVPLRLPPFHSKLNPKEFVLVHIKGYVATHNKTRR